MHSNKKSGGSRNKPRLRANGKHGGDTDKDPFPGDAPISNTTYNKYKRVRNTNSKGIRSTHDKSKYLNAAAKDREAVLQSARTELLLNEERGFLEVDSDDESYEISQTDITNAVDITSATKHFDLSLPQFGPYHLDFSRNGRNLLLGGSKGHVAAMDWVTKRLLCEINVMESVHDVKWLHMPTMFAVSQKKWVHIYDNMGTELHCIKQLHRVQKMEFLPYHFLLAAGNETGFLSWLDISIGQMVANFYSKSGRIDVMCQNPSNAVLVTGHANGVVNMWSPNIHEPLVKMMCHTKPIRAVAVDKSGKLLATATVDRTLKIWDLRNYKCLKSYTLGGGVGSLAFSQTGLLATTIGNTVEVYKDINTADVKKPFLRHKLKSFVKNIQFCPYEDVMGLGHNYGYTSILVPGAGEPNFDAMESNPYMSKNQRKEMEVKALLEKIQPEMITINPKLLGQVDVETLGHRQDTMQAKRPNAKKLPEIELKKTKISNRSTYFLKKEEKEKQKKALRRKSLKKQANVEISKPLGALGRFK